MVKGLNNYNYIIVFTIIVICNFNLSGSKQDTKKVNLLDSIFTGYTPDDEFKGYHYSISNEFFDKDVNVKEYSDEEKNVLITTNYSFIFDSNSIDKYDYFINYVITHIQDYDDINLQGYHFTFTLDEFYYTDETKNFQYSCSKVINNIEICLKDAFRQIDCDDSKIRYTFTPGGHFTGKYLIINKEVEVEVDTVR